ncbi:ShlB/FhaC/HecB family hemolysin secretion/activation protein [Herbaspirillum huttiense]|uniref:ShlB/FhaC/HecB family hemolysin secretion/activation protein n=1 Tax=Herbaspirillum huttiense TaxID=863372 RepID=UPI0031E1DB4C
MTEMKKDMGRVMNQKHQSSKMSNPRRPSAIKAKQRTVLLGLLVTMLGVQTALAQSTSPAMGGASVEELQHGINPRQVGGISNAKSVTVPALSEDQHADQGDATTVSIAGFKLVGQTVFDEKRLLEVARAQSGEYRFAQLEAVAALITNFYRDHGYLVAQAVIPAQQVKDGIVEIRVLEGKLESALTVVTTDKTVQDAIERIYAAVVCPKPALATTEAQCEGTIATDVLIDRIVLLSRENTGMKVFGSLAAGTQSGYTRLTLNAQPQRRVTGEVTVDNSGGASTGRWHAQGHIVAQSLLYTGDALDLLAGTSNTPESFKFFQLDYSVPVSAEGWRVGANLAQTQYSLSEAFSALQQNGISRSVGLYARYPLLLKEDARTDLTFALKGGRLSDNNKAFSNPRTYWQGSADLAGRLEDRWLGTPAITLWGGRWEHGDVRVTDANRALEDASLLKTAGTFNRLTLRGSREQGLGGQWSLFGAVTGMAGDKNLDPYFKFSLGGPYGVRAYPAGEASGDQGALGSVELRYAIAPVTVLSRTLSTRVALFYDRGWVKSSRYPLNPIIKNSDVRAGTGVQFELSDNDMVGVRVFWATAAGTGASASDGAHSRVGVLANAAF